MEGQVSVGDALRLLACVWLFVGGAYLVLWLLGDPGLVIWAPALMYLGGWWARRRLPIRVGVAAVVIAFAVGFPLVDALRRHVARAAADALASGIAVIPAVVVLVVWTRFSLARSERRG